MTWLAIVGTLTVAAYVSPADEAAEILEISGIKGGLIVHLDCGHGELTAALRANEACVVHGLSHVADEVEAARRHIDSLGLYGPISVDRLDGDRLPYADNLVNLIVTETTTRIPHDEIQRVLAPHGVFLEKQGDGWKKWVKPWPKEIDQWTHYLHDASGNPVAKDSRVGPPQHVQWIERPLWQRHHDMMATIPAMVSAGGRIFFICDEAPPTAVGLPDQWAVIARDAFNGTRLWSRPMGKWGWKYWHTSETAGGRWGLPWHLTRRLVASGRRVYVTLDFNGPLTALDADTGAVVKTYKGTEFTDEILYQDGMLLLSVSRAAQKPGKIADKQTARRGGKVLQGPAAKKQVVALNPESGEVLWRQGDYLGIATREDILERFTYLCLTANSKQVFLIEEEAIVSLDLKTGREMWRWPRPPRTTDRGLRPYKPGNMCTLVATDDVLVYAQPEEGYESKKWNRGVKSLFIGISAETGKTLWSGESGYWTTYGPPDIFVIDGLAWSHDFGSFDLIGVDLHSGEIKRRFSTQSVFDEVHHHRCYRNMATERYVLTGRRGIELLDLETEQCQAHDWVRGGCRYGVMPCNGLTYVPPHPCQCYIAEKLNGFYALASAPDVESVSQLDVRRPSKAIDPVTATTLEGRRTAKTEPTTSFGTRPEVANSQTEDTDRFKRGPAYGLALDPQPSTLAPTEWPTYRHDVQRSGAAKADGPATLKSRWQTDVGGRPSACTIAAGKVFVAVVDRHRICALDADSGKRVWSFTAGGRVDTPPTIYRGLALFGSADGWVYALRATDGELVWRFRAAPREKRIMAFGQLESPWPVHGTVLVQNGLAYVAAGRSTHLDGGVHVLAFKPETGELTGELPPVQSDAQGLADVLTGDGDFIYMRHLAFTPPGRAPPSPDGRRKLPKAARRAFSTAGLLDDSYFSRVGWSTRAGVQFEHPGWNARSNGQFDLLVFDDEFTYGFRSQRRGGYGGWFQPGTGAYRVTCKNRSKSKPRWSVTVPIRVRAMTATKEALFVAGSADVVDPADPWAAFEGRSGGAIQTISLTDGHKVTDLELDAAPVFDGLSAAYGKLFLATIHGQVICLADP